jgi:hypothetical protein
VFGVLFLLTGLNALFDSPLGGLCFIIISFLLLPPLRKFVYSKTNKELSVKARAATIFTVLVACGVFLGQAQDKKDQKLAVQQAEKAAKVRQENIYHYNQNKNQILAKANEDLSRKDYQSIVYHTSKYLVSGDKKLLNIYTAAKSAIEEKQKKEKTKSLLAKLKAVPQLDFEQNKNIYQLLSKMHPSDEKYKEKLVHYTAKIEQYKQEKIAAEERKKKIERQFSSWDGSHNNLERFIKEEMNDPDSYEHDNTIYWDKGSYLVVKTTYRGKNAFGGVVRNFVTAKVSLDGDILQILDRT